MDNKNPVLVAGDYNIAFCVTGYTYRSRVVFHARAGLKLNLADLKSSCARPVIVIFVLRFLDPVTVSGDDCVA